MRRRLLLPVLFALAVPAASAQATAMKVMSGDPPPDIEAVLGAERHFAQRAAQSSIRDAFYEVMDDQSILFRPGPVNGKEFFRDRPSNPGPLLSWEPTYCEVSQSGDLGWTTGPWRYTNKGDRKPSAFGHFATVWRYGVDRKWHVMIDVGHSQAQPAAGESLTFARLGGEKGPDRTMSLIELSKGAASLTQADRDYSAALAKDGVGAALTRWADPDVRVYRDERTPLSGVETAGRALAHEWDRGATAWDMRPGAISKSGDLAFTYGTVDLPPGRKNEPVRRNVMRIWRWSANEGWKLALDVTNPAPPGAAPGAAAAPPARQP